MNADTWHQARQAFGIAVRLSEGERATYLASIAEEVRAEVESLLAAHGEAGDFLESDVSAIPAGAQVGPYRVIEKLGQGGMGAVYRAQREAEGFQQNVALKVIPSLLATGEMNRRFLEERRILASLAHANIVRLLDAGEWEGGHYFAMEMVEGVPITEYCRSIPVRDRLLLFRTVCGAIHYAHQNLVVHRDIKPGNILVTAQGEVKVLDFGIAKLLDSAVVPGATTKLHPMSLDCASPEQVKGQPITTASDIYSLGVMLYELLAGVSPQGGPGRALDETVRRICELTPERPSTVARGISADLDSIVLRAMQKDPQLRYASAEEFSRDVERYLNGAPVLAREATLRYVARKFVERNKLAVGAALAGMLLVAAGVGSALWEGRVAARERALAQRRFEETRKLARSVIFDLQGDLASLPGTLGVRQKMIGQTVGYLESMAKDAGESPVLLLDIAGSYFRVGDVQGRVGASNLGDTAGALRSWEAALRLVDRVLARDPVNSDALNLGATVHGRLGTLLGFVGKRAEAADHRDRAVAMARRFQTAAPANTVSAEVLGGALFARAIGIEKAADRARAFEETLAIYESILRSDPAAPNKIRNVALCCKYISNALSEQHGMPRALEYAVRARDLDEARLAKSPGNREVLLDIANDLGTIGQIEEALGRASEAVATLRRNLELRERLAAEDPRDALMPERVARAHWFLALALERAGDESGAESEFRGSLASYRKLLADTPGSVVLLREAARIQERLAEMAWRLKRKGEACRLFVQAQGELSRAYPEGAISDGSGEILQRVKERLAQCQAAK